MSERACGCPEAGHFSDCADESQRAHIRELEAENARLIEKLRSVDGAWRKRWAESEATIERVRVAAADIRNGRDGPCGRDDPAWSAYNDALELVGEALREDVDPDP